MDSLARLRLRLTAWYAATLGLILLLLGSGLFITIRRQIARQLDDSLAQAAGDVIRAAHIRQQEAVSAQGAVVDALEELRIPERQLFLFDSALAPIYPPTVDARIRAALPGALARADHAVNVHASTGSHLRLRVEPFTLDGTPVVAAAAADRVELEDRYAALIVAFGAAALVAVLLVAGGGAFLARKSTAPVERTMAYTRRFMADAAHELRTPITVMRTRAEVALQRGRSADEYAGALSSIEREAERMSAIVDDLLLLARADAGERPLHREPLYLDDLTLDAASTLRSVAERRGVSVEMARYEEAPVLGDRALLRQLLVILIDNAVKFTPLGGRVNLEVSMVEGRPTVTVQDSGVGIAREHLPHIFDRFFRADSARGEADGSGLGLAIARWIAAAHDAQIDVSSVLGEGTRVTLKFAPAT